MNRINLPSYATKLRENGSRHEIFDFLRRKYVTLTPEEWVRQHFVGYMQSHLGFPPEVIANEVSLVQNGLQRRCDTVVYGPHAEPVLIVEYKSPEVRITQRTFDQICRYNMQLHVGWLVVSNGLQHFCCQMDYAQGSYRFLPQLPTYAQLLAPPML